MLSLHAVFESVFFFGLPAACFADASVAGIGAVCYLRIYCDDVCKNVSFVIGKSRVALVKPLSTRH